MNVNFELYKIFYVVVVNKSISKGAEQLMISQPAVTQAIKNLEGQLNTTLFIRTKKGIVLTSEGEELYEYIKEGMNYFINGTNKVLELKNLEAGVIKIGATSSITENFLMSYIKKFHKLYPKIEIKIVNQMTDVLFKELRNGNIDIVIGSESFNDNKDLLFKELRKIEYIFVSNNEKDQSLTLDQIMNRKLILQTVPSVARSSLDLFLKENNLNCNIGMEVVSHRLVMEFAKAGVGIGVVVRDYVNPELRDKELFEIKIDKKIPKRRIGVIVRKNFILSYAVKKFMDILNENN